MRPAGCAIRRSKLPADATATCTNSQNERCERADTVRCWWVGLTERESERYGGDGRREMSPDRRARVRDRGNIWATLCCASTGIYERTQAIKVLRLRSVGAPSPPYKGSVKIVLCVHTDQKWVEGSTRRHQRACGAWLISLIRPKGRRRPICSSVQGQRVAFAARRATPAPITAS